MLSEYGFERVAKSGTFRRATRDGWWGVHAPITRYSDGVIVVALTAIIRFDAVEKLVLKYPANPVYVDGPNRGTLALYLTADDGGIAFKVESKDDLPNAVAWAEAKLTSQALPFFNAFPTLEHVATCSRSSMTLPRKC